MPPRGLVFSGAVPSPRPACAPGATLGLDVISERSVALWCHARDPASTSSWGFFGVGLGHDNRPVDLWLRLIDLRLAYRHRRAWQQFAPDEQGQRANGDHPGKRGDRDDGDNGVGGRPAGSFCLIQSRPSVVAAA